MVWIEQHPRVAEPPFTVEPLAPTHDRAVFYCREPTLTEYITGPKAFRDIANYSAVVHACVDTKQVVWGYFTLHNYSISRHELLSSLYGLNWENPADRTGRKLLGDLRRAFPYQEVNVTLLGKLAAHQLMKGTGFGQVLMMQMLEKVWAGAQLTASRALILDAKNDTLVQVYETYGFALLSTQDRRMFMLMDTIKQLIEAK